MSVPPDKPLSFAAKASWASLGLALGSACLFLILQMVDQVAPFDRTEQGVLTGLLSRRVLCVLWSGEALAVVVGIGSFLLIRQNDVTSKSIIGIAARSLCGIVAGLFGTLVLWLVVGHIAFGF